MHDLPQNIEQYLTESGFSPTEIMVLRKLMETPALTLREMASKTGKSTGVLDQAVKKLIRKKIVGREIINDTPKYTLVSLDAISEWVRREAIQKRDVLKRKQENFESFIGSLKSDQSHPEMSHFHNLDGLQTAYDKLLEQGEEMLCYKPITLKEEEDPLHEFNVQYFRKRHKRGMFLRIIANNTPLARRFKSRDHFEYRETLLKDDGDVPLFEKIICGDTVACINHEKKSASFIRYPELAETERSLFEAEWKRLKIAHREPGAKEEPVKPEIDTSTKVLSGLREFFLSRRSLMVMMAFAVLSTGITYGLYQHSYNLNLERVRDKVESIAATGALQFDVADLQQLHTIDDIKKPEYAKVIGQLNDIRHKNENVQYAYIMRPTEKRGIWAVVADGDSLDPYAKIDINGDGKIDISDKMMPPGLEYDAMENGDGDNHEALSRPITIGPYTDDWGSFITGWAPIKGPDGTTEAVLGIDKFTEDVNILTLATFQPVYYFLGIFILFIFVRLIAYDRPLLKELKILLIRKKVILQIALFALISLVCTYGLYRHNYNLNLERVREQVKAIAATGASQFDWRNIDQIKTNRDVEKPIYKEMADMLINIRDLNPPVVYTYIIRPVGSGNWVNFVVDPTVLLPKGSDFNGDGLLTEADKPSLPEDSYEFTADKKVWLEILDRPTADRAPVKDQWGTWISGTAPIKNSDNETVAVLGVDRSAEDISQLTHGKHSLILQFLTILVLIILLKVITMLLKHRLKI